MDPCGGRSSHRIKSCLDARVSGGLRGDGKHRMSADQRRYNDCRLCKGTKVERFVLSGGGKSLMCRRNHKLLGSRKENRPTRSERPGESPDTRYNDAQEVSWTRLTDPL